MRSTVKKGFVLCAVTLTSVAAAPKGGRVDLGRIPLSFERAGKTEYSAQGEGFQARFSPTHASLAAAGHTLGIHFPGANPKTELSAEDLQAYRANYLTGAEPTQWRTGVEQFGRLRYRGIFPGVDLVFYGQRNLLEYDFVVRPGADPGAIAMEFDGARSMNVDANGALNVTTAAGEMIHHQPVIYQIAGTQRRTVAGRYVQQGRTVHFEVGAYDHKLPLVIDPIIQYATYLGGANPNGADDVAYAVALDSEDNVYVTGRTDSRDFPLQGAMQTTNKGSGDAFVVKLDPTGQKILYATYFGGGALEYPYAIAVDANGQAHIAGQTGSSDFPTMNPVQGKKTGLNNGFVTKLNAAGDGLIFSTYLGGERNDQFNGIGLDSFGNVYVGGYTNSSTFHTKDALQSMFGGNSDGILAKLGPSGELFFSTYFGTAAQDEIYAIAVDAAGNVYATGGTISLDLATANAFQQKPLSRDAFVLKLISDGQAVSYFTYLGGRGSDYGHAIAVDATGNVFVGGWTDSRDFPVTPGVFQPAIAGNTDAFLAKVNDLGSQILWASYLGGSARTNAEDEIIRSIALDPNGFAYITGNTTSSDFPVVRATQDKLSGGREAFVAKVGMNGEQLIFSTFAGGAGREDANAIAVSRLRAFYVVGQTTSLDLPLEKPLSDKRGATSDAFVTRICDPVMFFSAASMEFTYVQGTEELPAVQNLYVAACKNLSITATRSDEAAWLSAEVGAPDGALTAIGLTAAPQGLEPGDYTSLLTVSDPEVFFGPVSIPVTFKVLPPRPPEAPPSGQE